MLERNVVDGVHRLEHAAVNIYLIEDDTGVTVVDTGLPASFRHIESALTDLGRSSRDVRAVIITHSHFDHVGSALRAHRQWRVPVWIHAKDQFVAAHPSQYQHECSRLRYPLRYPKSLPQLAQMTLAGALFVRGISDTSAFESDAVLDVPGRPRAVFSPGHTPGHCAFHLPDRDAVLTGDALVTLNPYTGGTEPQIISGAATADSKAALASLSALADTGAKTMLPGHGKPWRDGIAAAVEAALRVGPS